MAETKAKSLAAKLSAVMGSVGRLKKDGHNAFQNYDYVSESEVVEAVGSLLVENGIMPVPSVKYHWQEKRVSKKGDTVMHSFVLLTYRFIDTESSEEIVADWLGEGSDSGDKGFYKAYTGAQKYALMKTLLIPTGDDPENDGNAAGEAPKQKQQPASQPAAKPSPPPTGKVGDISKAQVGMIKALCGNMAMTTEQIDGIKVRHNVQHIDELSKAEGSIVITELLERFLDKVGSTMDTLDMTPDERDALYEKHGLDVMKLDGKALRAVWDDLSARTVE